MGYEEFNPTGHKKHDPRHRRNHLKNEDIAFDPENPFMSDMPPPPPPPFDIEP